MMRLSASRALVLAWGFGALLGCGSADTAENAPRSGACGKVVLEGGGGVEMPGDGSAAPECEPSLCNYQSQEGCDSDQSCVPGLVDGALESTCAPAGNTPRGEACNDAKRCGRGQACAGGYCRKLCCNGDWTACDDGESCFITLSYQVDFVPTPSGAWLCYPVGTCSVLDPHPAACKETEECKLVDSRGSEACMPKSPGKLGEACSKSTGRLCGAGLTCVGRPDAETCRRLCRAEECGEPSCPAEEGACVHFDRDPPGVGECTPGR
jgi:hypothetical protein